ncbi:MAG: Holliday junction resolvase RuvX [Patescibacteria group bacterium]|nr:MAG: Holliday junction resolvase RuvX [Patescibacteria group bacterium]
MKVLGVDWGQKRIGLAISEDDLAEPYGTISSFEEFEEVVRKEKIERILLGRPEGKYRSEVERWGRRIEKEMGMQVVLRSEVFTTREALQKAIEAGKTRKARRRLDALAAALLLQEYLDERERVGRDP